MQMRQKMKGRPPAPSPGVKHSTNHIDSGAKTAAPQKLLHSGASGFAASQPRKPEAARIVDWFYARPPCQLAPPWGIIAPSKRKEARNSFYGLFLLDTMRRE